MLSTSVCINDLSLGCTAVTKDPKVSVDPASQLFISCCCHLSAAVAVVWLWLFVHSKVQGEKAALIVHMLFSHWRQEGEG